MTDISEGCPTCGGTGTSPAWADATKAPCRECERVRGLIADERVERTKVERMFDCILDAMGAMSNPSEVDAMALGISPDEAEEIRAWIRKQP